MGTNCLFNLGRNPVVAIPVFFIQIEIMQRRVSTIVKEPRHHVQKVFSSNAAYAVSPSEIKNPSSRRMERKKSGGENLSERIKSDV